MADIQIRNNAEQERFEAQIGEHLAQLKYRMLTGAIDLYHTDVPEALEGQGVGSALARYGLDYARQNGLRVLPTCAFVQGYLKRHPEYQDILL